MYKNTIENFIFFKSFSDETTSKLLTNINKIKGHRNEIVLARSEHLDEIFFLKSGKIRIEYPYKNKTYKLLDLRRHEHFGEVLIVNGERSPVQLRIVTDYAEILLVKKSDFLSINLQDNEKFKEIYSVSGRNNRQAKRTETIVEVHKTNILQKIRWNNDRLW